MIRIALVGFTIAFACLAVGCGATEADRANDENARLLVGLREDVDAIKAAVAVMAAENRALADELERQDDVLAALEEYLRAKARRTAQESHR